MRVVLDTNVLLSGFFTRGVCEALLDACVASDECEIVLSEYILREFKTHATKKFGAPADEVERTTALLRQHARIVESAPLPANVCPDVDDLPVLGAAVACGANALVTGDAALLAMGHINNIPIISPRALFERLL